MKKLLAALILVFVMMVSAVVAAPVITVSDATMPTSAVVGVPYTGNFTVNDTSYNLASVTVTGLPSGFTNPSCSTAPCSEGTYAISGTPTATGTITLGISATNDNVPSETTTAPTRIITVSVNQAPTITNTQVTATLVVGESFTYTITALDPESQPLTFSASGLPTGSNFDTGSHVFSWTPTASQASATAYTVTFTVSDQVSTPDTLSLQLTVISVLQDQENRFINLTNQHDALESEFNSLEDDVEDSCDDYEDALEDDDDNDADDALDDLEAQNDDLENLQDDLDDLEDDLEDLADEVDNDNSAAADDLEEEIDDFIDDDVADLRNDIEEELDTIDNECQESDESASATPVEDEEETEQPQPQQPVVVVQQSPQQPAQTQTGQATTPAAQQPAEQVSVVSQGTTQQPAMFPSAQRVQVFDTKGSKADVVSIAVMAGVGVLLLLLLVVMLAVLLRR